ncbi:hypothetical protein ACS0TY_016697 [Phlomoides rotata]
MFVNNKWLRKWPNQSLRGLRRSLSDHVPLVLQSGCKDWGPRPFRFMNSWIEHPQFKAFFLEKWNSYSIEGWAAFRLKEKLKLFKCDLRGWNKVIFGNIDFNIDTKKEEIEILDRIDDAMGLEEVEIIQRRKSLERETLSTKGKNEMASGWGRQFKLFPWMDKQKQEVQHDRGPAVQRQMD